MRNTARAVCSSANASSHPRPRTVRLRRHSDSLIKPLASLYPVDISSLQTLTARTSSPGSTHTPISNLHPSLHFASSARRFGNCLLQAPFLSQACADLDCLHLTVNTSNTYIHSVPACPGHSPIHTTNLHHTKQPSQWLVLDPRGRRAVRAPWPISRTT